MIQGHEKFRLQDKNGRQDLFVEVNWKDDPNIQDCRVVKFTLNGVETFIDRDNLLAMVFAIGRAEDQQKLIPQTLKKVRWYETVVGVKATKDIHKGEMMNFPIKISLPESYQNVIGEVKKDNPIIVPK